MFRRAWPLWLILEVGMMLPGNGAPLVGSLTVRTFEKNGLDALSNSLKSPLRMATLGTVPVLVLSYRRLIHSSPQKKKSLLRSELKRCGRKIGPPISKPY